MSPSRNGNHADAILTACKACCKLLIILILANPIFTVSRAQQGERFSILPMSIARSINYSSCSATENLLRKLGWESGSYTAFKRDSTVLVVEHAPTGAGNIGRIHAVPISAKISVDLKNQQYIEGAQIALSKENYTESNEIKLMTRITTSQQGARKVFIENALIFECSRASGGIDFIEYR